MTITPEKLRELERTVGSLMTEGRWMEGIELIRSRAKAHGMSSNQLAKQVAELALELGHASPIRQVERLEPVD